MSNLQINQKKETTKPLSRLAAQAYMLAGKHVSLPFENTKKRKSEGQEKEKIRVDLFPTLTKIVQFGVNRFVQLLALGLLMNLGTPLSAYASQYIIHHGGFALNTNWNFSKIDGSPRMSIYNTDFGDIDQHFEFIQVGNAMMLKHRSTGRCLNAYRPRNGGTVNVWNCNPNDPEQLWSLLHKSGTIYLIRAHGTNFCVDNYNRVNEGNVHMWICDWSNPNQLWDIHNVATGQGYVKSEPTLIRSGGITFTPGIIGGQQYSAKALYDLYKFGANIEAIVADRDYLAKDYQSETYGKEITYIAKWGTYTRLTGERAEDYRDAIRRHGTNFVLFSSLVGGGFGGWPGAVIGGGLGLPVQNESTKIADKIDRCLNTDTKQAYLRFHLINRSWQQAKYYVPVQGTAAYLVYPSVSCE